MDSSWVKCRTWVEPVYWLSGPLKVNKDEHAVQNDPFPDGNDSSDTGMHDDFHIFDIRANINKNHEITQKSNDNVRVINSIDTIFVDSNDNLLTNENSRSHSSAVNNSSE